MKNKLLKIARYLGQNGFYEEAANLKKLAEDESPDFIGPYGSLKDYRARQTAHTSGDLQFQPVRREEDAGGPYAHLMDPFDLEQQKLRQHNRAISEAKSQAETFDAANRRDQDREKGYMTDYNPDVHGRGPTGRQHEEYFAPFADWDLANKFFSWAKMSRRVPDYHALYSYLNAEYETPLTSEYSWVRNFPKIRLPMDRWAGIRNIIEQDHRFVPEKPDKIVDDVVLDDLHARANPK